MKDNALSGVIRAYPLLAPYVDDYELRSGDALEYYGEGERDSPNPAMRVIEAPPGARSEDIAGEIVSHDLATGRDPPLTDTYRQFERSMTSEQQQRLYEQYLYAVQNFGERRPFEVWRKMSGQPAYFRGYLFDQWESPEELYTPGQIAAFDKVQARLRGSR